MHSPMFLLFLVFNQPIEWLSGLSAVARRTVSSSKYVLCKEIALLSLHAKFCSAPPASPAAPDRVVLLPFIAALLCLTVNSLDFAARHQRFVLNRSFAWYELIIDEKESNKKCRANHIQIPNHSHNLGDGSSFGSRTYHSARRMCFGLNVHPRLAFFSALVCLCACPHINTYNSLCIFSQSNETCPFSQEINKMAI